MTKLIITMKAGTPCANISKKDMRKRVMTQDIMMKIGDHTASRKAREKTEKAKVKVKMKREVKDSHWEKDTKKEEKGSQVKRGEKA